jgi:hypothetical protein
MISTPLLKKRTVSSLSHFNESDNFDVIEKRRQLNDIASYQSTQAKERVVRKETAMSIQLKKKAIPYFLQQGMFKKPKPRQPQNKVVEGTKNNNNSNPVAKFMMPENIRQSMLDNIIKSMQNRKAPVQNSNSINPCSSNSKVQQGSSSLGTVEYIKTINHTQFYQAQKSPVSMPYMNQNILASFGQNTLVNDNSNQQAMLKMYSYITQFQQAGLENNLKLLQNHLEGQRNPKISINFIVIK